MRRAAKRDANERDIVDALRAVGASVEIVSGRGLPDLLVGWRGENLLMEIKGARGKLTKDQELWHVDWRGQVVIVRSVEEALSLIGVDCHEETTEEQAGAGQAAQEGALARAEPATAAPLKIQLDAVDETVVE